MEGHRIFNQLISLNKTFFYNSYDTVSAWQEQSERLLSTMLDSNPFLSDQNKGLVNDWCSACKKARGDLKKSIESSYTSLEKMFSAEP